ncbi:MAG: hypothetical protein CL923_08445 [Deltaproteobacteria bacterium]|nr:hypothetical protein [Deltaproteobacteria bacterium]
MPIASGRIESSHRSRIQKRLKLPGAWWKLEHADSMLAPRVARKKSTRVALLAAAHTGVIE